MAKRHFLYGRESEIRKLDEKGQPIPILDEEGKSTGKFEMEKVVLHDTLDLTRVIRTHVIKEGEYIVSLLADGHEVTERTPVLKNKNKPASRDNITEEKSRVWVQSEIHIKGEDVQRYYDALSSIEI